MIDVPEIYREHLRAVTGDDPEAIRAVWEPDGLLEFPYADSLGSARRLEGIDAIVAYFAGLGLMRDFSFRDARGWKIQDRDEYVLEMHGSAVLTASGAPYEQDYIVRFGTAASGRIAWMREFWDPTRIGSPGSSSARRSTDSSRSRP